MTNAASTLTLDGNVIVTGTLTLTAGKINTGPNIITLTNATPANQLVGGSSSSYVYSTTTLRVGVSPAMGLPLQLHILFR